MKTTKAPSPGAARAVPVKGASFGKCTVPPWVFTLGLQQALPHNAGRRRRLPRHRLSPWAPQLRTGLPFRFPRGTSTNCPLLCVFHGSYSFLHSFSTVITCDCSTPKGRCQRIFSLFLRPVSLSLDIPAARDYHGYWRVFIPAPVHRKGGGPFHAIPKPNLSL